MKTQNFESKRKKIFLLFCCDFGRLIFFQNLHTNYCFYVVENVAKTFKIFF